MLCRDDVRVSFLLVRGEATHYASLGKGITQGRDANPQQTVVLPGGGAQLGLFYGSESWKANSSGLYIKATAEGTFSILFHHQPSGLIGPDEIANGPLVYDPKWQGERKPSVCRMLYHRTATKVPSVDPSMQYTMAHLPDFSDPVAGDGMLVVPSDTLGGATWFVGQSGNVYVAFLPLGTLTEDSNQPAVSDPPATMSLYSEGSWIYLRLEG